MAFDKNTADITANGGGEASATGNTLIYDLPSNPSNSTLYAKVKKMVIDNGSGANSRMLFADDDTIGNNMPTVAPLAVEVSANGTTFLTEADLADLHYITTGIIGQASNGATSLGHKVSVEVDVF